MHVGRRSIRVQDWEIDPTEIECIPRGPHYGAQSRFLDIEPSHRGSDAGGIGQPVTCSGLLWQAHLLPRYVVIHQVKEGSVGGVSVVNDASSICGAALA